MPDVGTMEKGFMHLGKQLPVMLPDTGVQHGCGLILPTPLKVSKKQHFMPVTGIPAHASRRACMGALPSPP